MVKAVVVTHQGGRYHSKRSCRWFHPATISCSLFVSASRCRRSRARADREASPAGSQPSSHPLSNLAVQGSIFPSNQIYRGNRGGLGRRWFAAPPEPLSSNRPKRSVIRGSVKWALQRSNCVFILKGEREGREEWREEKRFTALLRRRRLKTLQIKAETF